MVQFSIRTMQKDLEAASGRPMPLVAPPPANAPLVPSAALKITPPIFPPLEAKRPAVEKAVIPSSHEKIKSAPAPATTKFQQPKLAPPKPPSSRQRILALIQEAKILFDQQFFEEAIKKFEAILLLKPSWWEKQKIKNYINRGQKKILAVEYAKQKAQKKLEEKLKGEQELKLKAAEELKIRSQKQEQEKQKRLAEEKRLQEKQEFLKKEAEEKTRIADELARFQTEIKKQVHQITEEKQRQLELKKEELQILTETKKVEEEKIRLEREKKEIYEKIPPAAPKFSEKTLQQQLAAEKEALEKKTIEQIRLAAELAKLKEEAARQAPTVETRRMPPPTTAIPPTIPMPPRIPSVVLPPATLPISRPPLSAQKPKLTLKPATIFSAILIILILGAGFIYWSNFQKLNQPPKPPLTPIEEKPLTPTNPFFKVEITETINIKKTEENKLLGQLDEIKDKPLKEGFFKHILIKQTNGQEKYLDLKTLVKFFPSGLPIKVLESLTDQYTFFLYSHQDLPSDPFLAGLGKNRFGLVIKIKDADKMPSLMLDWENILTSGPLYKQTKLLTPSAPFEPEKFKTATYQDTSIRYLNLPTKYSSIDYAILEDQLLITTSQESMQALIDRLK